MKFRLIDTSYSTPSMNMAIDESLLTSKLPVLRFYQWEPAGLSIGYFQAAQNFNLKALKKHKVGLVRRLTGGNAVLHDKELTYSFIIDEKQMPGSITESYRKISRGLLQGLKNLGLSPKMNPYAEKGQKSAVCFNDTSWYEIIVNKKKLIGSAQKRIDGKLLQHGAVLIDADVEKYCSLFNNCSKGLIEKVEERMTSINDELKKKSSHGTGEPGVAPAGVARRAFSEGKWPSAAMDGWVFSKRVNYKKVKEAMIDGFEKALNIEFIEDGLTEKELKLAEKLDKKRYSSKKWNFKV